MAYYFDFAGVFVMTADTIGTDPSAVQPLAATVRHLLKAGRARLAAAALGLLSARYALPPGSDGEEEAPYDEATMVAVSLLCSVHF
jgi:hypothetical protein